MHNVVLNKVSVCLTRRVSPYNSTSETRKLGATFYGVDIDHAENLEIVRIVAHDRYWCSVRVGPGHKVTYLHI